MNRPALFRRLPLVGFTVLIVGLACSAQATTVYKKKKDGVTEYSQTETTGTQSKKVKGRDPAKPAEPAAPKPKTEAEKACDNARMNLQLLGSGKPLSRGKDKDGKDIVLTAEERASETSLAEAQVKARCAPTPPPAKE